MSKMIAHGFRVAYVILFAVAMVMVLSAVDPAFFNFNDAFTIVAFFLFGVELAVDAIVSLSIMLAFQIAYYKTRIPILGAIFSSFIPSGDDQSQLVTILIGSVESPGILKVVMPKSTVIVNDVEVTLAQLLAEDPMQLLDLFYGMFGSWVVLTLIPIAFLSGFGFIRDGDTRLAIVSFIGLQLVLGAAIWVDKVVIPLTVDWSSITTVLFSPIFQIGLLLYILLEVAFQTSYALNIIEPNWERQRRIKGHLERIRGYVPPSEEKITDEDVRAQVGSQSKKYDILAASYLREMVEKRVFRKGQSEQDIKATMRLQGYLNSLEQMNPKTEETLTAQAAQPRVRTIITRMITNMTFRIIFVILFTWIIMNPVQFLNILGIATSFPQLLESIELYQPEFRTVAIANIALLFIFVGIIMHSVTVGRAEEAEAEIQRIETIVEFEDRERGKTTIETE